MRRDVFVSVVIPLINDADIIQKVIGEVEDVLGSSYKNYELICVDDGSWDCTLSLLEHCRKEVGCLRYVRLSRQFGLEYAIECGLAYAIGDVVVVLRPECDPPQLIPEFVDRAQSINGIAVGTRNLFEGSSWLYKLAYDGFYLLCKWLLDRPQIYCSTHYIAFTRTALNSLLRIRDNHRYVRVLSMQVGYEVQSCQYKPIQRRYPSRQRQAFSVVRDCVSMIASNSMRPLRYAGGLAILTSLLNIGYLGYILFMRLFVAGIQPGWAATAFQSSAMFGLLFLVVAVICEYTARILGEVTDRPLYFIGKELQSNVMLTDAEVSNVVYDEEDVSQSR